MTFRNINIFHHNDADGVVAGMLAKLWVDGSSVICDKTNTFAINYGFDLDERIDRETVCFNDLFIFVDFSFSGESDKAYLKDIMEKTDNVVIIDHHASSIKMLKDSRYSFIKNAAGIISDKWCGAMLIYLFTRQYPEIGCMYNVRMDSGSGFMHRICDDEEAILKDAKYPNGFMECIDQWDTRHMPNGYEHFLKFARPFHLAFKFNSDISDEQNSELNALVNGTCWSSYWRAQYDKVFEEVLRRGWVIADVIDHNNLMDYKSRAFECTIDKYNCVALNCNGSSDYCISINRETDNKYDIIVLFSYNGDGWKYTLYSDKPEVDCESIAVIFGGGGHKGAAGFRSKELLLSKGCHIDTVDAVSGGGV